MAIPAIVATRAKARLGRVAQHLDYFEEEIRRAPASTLPGIYNIVDALQNESRLLCAILREARAAEEVSA